MKTTKTTEIYSIESDEVWSAREYKVDVDAITKKVTLRFHGVSIHMYPLVLPVVIGLLDDARILVGKLREQDAS